MSTDYETYRNAVAAATEEKARALETYERDYQAIEKTWAESTERLREAKEAALEELKKSADPLVVWIVTNAMPSFPEHAEIVLGVLPATREELDALAVEHGWCSDWERYMLSAERAGVLPAREAMAEEGEQMMRWMRATYGSEAVGVARRYLSGAIRAEVERALSERPADSMEKIAAEK